MRYMIGFPIAWLVVYLMFAFITLSFSPSDWTEPYRILCALFGMFWGLALSYRMKQDCKWAY
jgi:hypothetical protein